MVETTRIISRFSRFNSLRVKLTVFVSFIMLVTFATLGFTTNLLFTETMNEQIEKEALSSIHALTHEIDQFLASQASVIETLAKAAEEVHGQRDPSVNYLRKALQRHPEFSTFVLAEDVLGTRAFSDDGQVFDMSERPFMEELAAGRSIISDPMVSQVDDALSIIIGSPIMKQGQVVGSLTATIPIDQLIDRISAVKFGETGYAFVMDSSGLMIWHPNEEFVRSQHVSHFEIKELEDAFQQSLEGAEGTFAYTYEGERKFGAYMQNISGWSIMLSAPYQELYEPIYTLSQKQLLYSMGLLLIAIIMTGIISIPITNPMRRLKNAIDTVASGDLTKIVRVRGGDEVAQASQSFNGMVEALRQLIAQVSETSLQLAAASQELNASASQTSSASETIAISVQEVATGAEEQAESSTDGFDRMKEISGYIEQSATKVQSITELAASASTQSTEGVEVIKRAVAQMEAIGRASETMSQTVAELKQNSEAIHEMVQVIREIADQTNLLALNASIEAARAGEDGRGFSVVAAEVRKLAEQSAQSAEEIAARIQTIWNGIDYTADSIQMAVQEVDEGSVAVQEAGELFSGIEQNVVAVADQLQELTDASMGIVRHSDQLVKTMEMISSTSDQTAAATQTVSAAVEEQLATMEDITSSAANLADRAEQLQAAIEKFKYN